MAARSPRSRSQAAAADFTYKGSALFTPPDMAAAELGRSVRAQVVCEVADTVGVASSSARWAHRPPEPRSLGFVSSLITVPTLATGNLRAGRRTESGSGTAGDEPAGGELDR